MSNFELSVQFFLQLAAILAACRVVGWLARFAGQPQVVGEMIAGVALGPSLLGLIAPDFQKALFPPTQPATSILYAVAQLGLTLYMFLVGAEFRVEILRARWRAAAAVSSAGMIAPFVLGAWLAWSVANDPTFFRTGVATHEAMLFLGAAMAITAFPMLARIIYERGIAGTPLGTLALAAGSIDDAAAWCVLAVVLAMFKDNMNIAAMAIGGGVAYVLFVSLIVGPMLRPLGRAASTRGGVSGAELTVILTLLMLAAWYTDVIGLYAVFGAFVLGAAMPRGALSLDLQRRLAPLTTHLLLPLFFVYSGLNTRIDLVDTAYLWLIAGVALAAACAGKLIACWAAALASGEKPRDAFAVGALMNARGLMELIILNIGLERGIITPQLFSIMVIMAIVTTLMATPLFRLAYAGGPGPQTRTSATGEGRGDDRHVVDVEAAR